MSEVTTLTKEKAVESPDCLSTFSTALLAGTCSSGPSNCRYSIENLINVPRIANAVKYLSFVK